MYTNSIYQAHRRKTRPVSVGDVWIGGDHPVLIQSMTTTPTTDTDATVSQIESLVQSGCPLVRVTVPRQADLDNLKNIKKALLQKKIFVPLVADIHFLPKLALGACDYVDKVRINPGNFADRKRFEIKAYSDQEYELELERVASEFIPIVKRAKENGVAIRIGTNHGSLSDRIMNRFGDTPEGMVASAMEFVEIAQGENFHDLVLSMKSSNPFVMVGAYRLLVNTMNEKGWDYPLHLGVTEAGDGQDGRIKSSVGISTLLHDGLGDTIRVSLTEDPEKEIPVARTIVDLFAKAPLDAMKSAPNALQGSDQPTWDPYQYQRRTSRPIDLGSLFIGAAHPLKVCTPVQNQVPDLEPPVEWVSLQEDTKTLPTAQKIQPRLQRVSAQDVLKPGFDIYSIMVNQTWNTPKYLNQLIEKIKNKKVFLRIEKVDQIPFLISMIENMQKPIQSLGVEISGYQIVTLARAVTQALMKTSLELPIHLHMKTLETEEEQEKILRVSGELGAILCDGIGDSLEVSTQDPQTSHQLAFSVLQATRLRMSRTDYISCPSCGRTLFDLQETTARIRSQTNHLKGVKIAIMGCIVNGPGEMADADFGYVGSGPGKINLYVGKTCVKKNIDQKDADQTLISLIQEHGRWCEP